MTDQEIQAIRWVLAKHLEGMREACPCLPTSGVYCAPCAKHWTVKWKPCDRADGDGKHHGDWCEYCQGCSYRPIPLDGKEISVGKLIKAIEAEGHRVAYGTTRHWDVRVGEGPGWNFGDDPSLAVAYLKAVGKWPVKEDAHA